jgi:hypothetical protein
MNWKGRRGVAIAALASGIGCSGSPLPGTAICHEPLIPAEELLYPIPGATGVPTAAGSLVFGGGLPGVPVVLSANGAQTKLGNMVAAPSPLPSPMASAPAGFVLSSAPYPALDSATKYTVSIILDFGGAACPATVLTAGSFTTQ